MGDDFAYYDRCGARVAMKYRHALTGRLCWRGKSGKIKESYVEVNELPDATAETFDWLCSCGQVTSIEDCAPR
jgi:hypothetical protein